MFRRGLVLALALMAAPAGAAAQAPLDVPVPTQITAEDLLAPRSEDGDFDGSLPGAAACSSAERRPISLPADDRPHNTSYLEWWWWRGSLKAPRGRRFGFTVTFASKPWARVYGADYTVTDLSRGSFHYDREPTILGPPADRGNGMRLQGENVFAAGGGGRDRLRYQIDGYRIDLKVRPRKRPVRQLGDGHVSVYCNEASFYSRVGSRVSGTIEANGRRRKVRGTTTFDHMWGFSPGIEVAGWDWMNFELDDGRHVFLVVVEALRGRQENSLHTGSISDAKGRVTPLHRGDFTVTPTRYWQRDATCRYPVEWDVDVLGERLHLRPSLDSTEVRAINDPAAFTLWPVYWDGETVISGDASGRGWLDMKYCYA